MNLDIPHMIATAVIIFIVIAVIEYSSLLKNPTRGRKTLFTFIGVFVALAILNFFWPYGASS